MGNHSRFAPPADAEAAMDGRIPAEDEPGPAQVAGSSQAGLQSLVELAEPPAHCAADDPLGLAG